MLAATSNRSSALGLFQVVLRAANGPAAVQVSDPLRTHAVEVLKQAVLVAANPNAITASTAREAIELALRLRDHAELSRKLAAMPTLDSIPPELARDLLDSLQPRAA